MPGSLFESELFGHERGAYTGADKSQTGFFEAAHNATIFLDDIDDFPLHLQPKLLRVVENKELIRIGANNPIPSDVRIITSSKVELKELVDKGTFRSDLINSEKNHMSMKGAKTKNVATDRSFIPHHFL